MRRLFVLLAPVCLASALPWPSVPQDSVHPIGNSWGCYQNYGSSPYCHNGQDIMVAALSPAVAIKPGYVKRIWLGGSPMYNGVTVADSAGAAFCAGFMYYHIDNSTIQVQEGDTVAVGDTLGLIATWSVAEFHHNHFSANRNSGVVWPSYGAFYRNPLLDLAPDDDSIAPTFLDAYTGQRFAICLNNTSTYQVRDSVYGTVDLICRLDERINHRLWKVAVYRLDYYVRDTFGNYVVPLMRGLEMSDSISSSSLRQSRTVYKQDAVCNTRCNYDSLARRFYYIFTNSDGDSLIEAADSLAGWNTTLVADGDYWVKVIARDEYGNTATDSMMVKVKNHPTSRRDVGVTRIVSPPALVESGAVVTPACTVYNYGSAGESYTVRMTIGSRYDTVAVVASHVAGEKREVVFPDWVVDCSLGRYAVTCSTRLTRDTFPANDRREDTVSVEPRVSICRPSGPDVRLRVEVQPNPSRRPVRFQVFRTGGPSVVELSILDAAGRRVRTLRDGNPDGASYVWDGGDESGRRLPGGVYFCRFIARPETIRLVLLE